MYLGNDATSLIFKEQNKGFKLLEHNGARMEKLEVTLLKSICFTHV